MSAAIMPVLLAMFTSIHLFDVAALLHGVHGNSQPKRLSACVEFAAHARMTGSPGHSSLQSGPNRRTCTML